jgi:hypothetical protein
MLKHFVVTRLGLGIYSERWFAKMTDLFEAVTLPSLLQQTSRDFIWLIVIDADMPPRARDRIGSLVRSNRNFHLVSIDVTRLLRVRQGCFDWVWDHCQDFILEQGLLQDPHEYVITSLIDADDAWHRDAISTVNRFMSDRLPDVRVDEETRGTWLRHTAGMAVTFPRGYKWFVAANSLESMEHPFQSMAVFIAARSSSGISACSSRHLAWPSYCNVVAFELAEIAGDLPMWLWVRHDEATQPWDAQAARSVDCAGDQRLAETFGIDLHKVQRWREKYYSEARADSLPRTYAGRDAASQYDRIFRIAALNRQIEALGRRRQKLAATGSAEDKTLGDMIAQNRAQRAALIEVLRSNGQDASA